MAYFWLQDEDANILELDSTVQELTLGGNKRGFSVSEFLGANGGSVRGWGAYSQKEFLVSRKEKVEGSDATAWNSRRNDFMVWFTKPRYKAVYLHIKTGEGDVELKTRVYCEEIPEDKYKFYRISDTRSFKLFAPSGTFENVTATTGDKTYTGIIANDPVTIVNNGVIDCPVMFSYTPTATAVIFRVILYSNFGFTLTVSGITSGSKISLDTSNGKLEIAGVVKQLSQFLTSGSVFNIPAGTSTIYVSVDEPGTFEYSFNERFI